MQAEIDGWWELVGAVLIRHHVTENDCRFLNDCKAETKVRDGCLIVGILSSLSAK